MTDVRKVTSAPMGAGFEYVLSDATVDSYGDVVEASGWDLSRFDTNPIALFNHDSNAPIGRWSNVRVEDGKLKGRLNFAKAGTSARIDEIRSLAEQGILRATSVGFAPIAATPLKSGGKRYTKQLLHEVSLVSIPANPNAVQLARSLHVSSDTMSLVFGEHANSGDGIERRGTHGEHAASPIIPIRKTPMTTLSQRIEDLQNGIVAKRDKLIELNAADVYDADAIEELNRSIEDDERQLAGRKASEAKLAGTTALTAPGAPAIHRAPLGMHREVKGLDLMVRATLVNAVSMFSGKSIDRVLDERYPGHEATAIVAKADQVVGTTSGSGWATELMQTSYQGFTDALRGMSIYPEMRSRGMALSFDSSKTAYVPGLTAGGANGSFFAEGAPMRVGRITTNSFTMTRRKLGVIVPFTREAAEQSTPSLEGLVRNAILGDTAAIIDSALLDNAASSAVRPAGLLNGVSAVASGYGGGDHIAVINDFKALLAPFIAANAADNIVVIMNPAQGLAIDFMLGNEGVLGDWFSRVRSRFTFVESTYATANRLIAVRMTDFVTAMGDAPRFEMSTQATIHMEDSTPLEIVSGTGPTTADPVRSFFQTDTMGIRMIMDIAWAMRRTGMVQWIDGTSW